MAAGRVTADVKSTGIATEASGIFISPGDAAAHLLGHDADVAVRCAHRDEVKRDVVHAGIDKKFSREAVVLGFATQPTAAMNEHKNRRIGRFSRIDIEAFDRRRSVSEPLRRAKMGACLIAACRVPLKNLADERCIGGLIVGRVEFDLVHVHPHPRTLIVRWRSNRAHLSQRWRYGHRGRRSKHGAARDLRRDQRAIQTHGFPTVFTEDPQNYNYFIRRQLPLARGMTPLPGAATSPVAAPFAAIPEAAVCRTWRYR